jgi:hypothetical protein
MDGLSGIATATQLFTSILQTYRFLITARGLSHDAPKTFWKLRIQKIRLSVWGRYWGLEQGRLDESLKKEGILEDVEGILSQMQDLFKDTEKLEKRYGLRQEGQENDSPDTTLTGSSRSSVLNDDRLKWTSKLRWAFTDKDNFETLVTDLKDFNDGLYSLLRLGEFESIDVLTQSEVLRAPSEVTAVEHMQDACLELLEASKSATKYHPSGLQGHTYSNLLLGAATKRLLIMQSRQVIPPLGIHTTSFNGRSNQLRPYSQVTEYPRAAPSNKPTLASYNHSPVLIEWKEYERDSVYQYLIARRVDNLVQLLSKSNPKPADFHFLECLGYFEDVHFHRYGYLFEIPPNMAPVQPVSLHDLLMRGKNAVLPDLGDRFAIAQALATSVIRLHDCGWVHAALRSSNVIFFHFQQTGNLVLHDPRIVGHTYSRFSDPEESTIEYSQNNLAHNLYRHPEAIRSSSGTTNARFAQIHDLYSLGIILLEIGLWDQVGAMWKEKYTIKQFREKLLKAYVPRLGHKMGAIYRDVVHDLLSSTVSPQHHYVGMDGVHELSSPMFGGAGSGFAAMEGTEMPGNEWVKVIFRLLHCKA